MKMISAGTGLKPEHAPDIFESERAVDFFEIHAENYMGAGGPPHHLLRRIAENYALSVHGVGLSIGGTGPLDRDHLVRLKKLIGEYRPAMFSEHLAWSSHDGVYLNDLLPLPYNAETMDCVVRHIDEVQHTLNTRMLLENPSTYVSFGASDMDEVEFLRAIAERTGCGLLLDVSNVYVSSVNHGFDPAAYIDRFPVELVGEIHLAGFAEDRDTNAGRLLIDAHGAAVADAVWSLYRRTLAWSGPVPTLIEWDNDVPDFAAVVAEVSLARAALADEAGRRDRRRAA
ncbi:MAG: uncharacterized protein QOD89_522 [Bradyrhizobium sp.]|jgi:uncharacterized protein (UPF0276 family)|nr:uncharacterized protein [Bradyrhizobium sp.]